MGGGPQGRLCEGQWQGNGRCGQGLWWRQCEGLCQGQIRGLREERRQGPGGSGGARVGPRGGARGALCAKGQGCLEGVGGGGGGAVWGFGFGFGFGFGCPS